MIMTGCVIIIIYIYSQKMWITGSMAVTGSCMCTRTGTVHFCICEHSFSGNCSGIQVDEHTCTCMWNQWFHSNLVPDSRCLNRIFARDCYQRARRSIYFHNEAPSLFWRYLFLEAGVFICKSGMTYMYPCIPHARIRCPTKMPSTIIL